MIYLAENLPKKNKAKTDAERIGFYQESLGLLEKAQSFLPDDPDLSYKMSLLHYRIGRRTKAKEERDSRYRQAFNHLERSLQRRPLWGIAWIHRARLGTLLRNSTQSVVEDFQKANQLAPYDPDVQFQILALGCKHWYRYPSKVKGMIRESRNKMLANPAQKRRIAAVRSKCGMWRAMEK